MLRKSDRSIRFYRNLNFTGEDYLRLATLARMCILPLMNNECTSRSGRSEMLVVKNWNFIESITVPLWKELCCCTS